MAVDRSLRGIKGAIAVKLHDILVKIFGSPAILHATDKRVDLIFGQQCIQFDDDVGTLLDISNYHGFRGGCGDLFNLWSIGSFLMRYARPRGYELQDIGEAFADWMETVCAREGRVPPEHFGMVREWLTARRSDKSFRKSAGNACYIDFSVYFLLDVLKLNYTVVTDDLMG